MSPVVRFALPEDIPGIEALEKACFSMPWTQAMLERQLSSKTGIFIVAEGENGAILGYAGMNCVLDECYIANVAVAPNSRRLGLGDMLVSRLVEEARRLGMAFITLEVRAGNVPAAALYEKHGFRTMGRRKNYYEAPREDALLMTLFLKDEENL